MFAIQDNGSSENQQKKVSEADLQNYAKHFDSGIAHSQPKKLRKATRDKSAIVAGTTGAIGSIVLLSHFCILCYTEFVETDVIKQTLTDYFSRQVDIDTVLLFGSFAKNTVTPHSDIDIAVHSSSPLTYQRLSELQTELALLCKREIDLADLSLAEGVFLYQIMTTGIKIKISNSVFVKYLTKALCFREDFLPIITFSRQEKIRRFIYG